MIDACVEMSKLSGDSQKPMTAARTSVAIRNVPFGNGLNVLYGPNDLTMVEAGKL